MNGANFLKCALDLLADVFISSPSAVELSLVSLAELSVMATHPYLIFLQILLLPKPYNELKITKAKHYWYSG